jgi:hypothetical protein
MTSIGWIKTAASVMRWRLCVSTEFDDVCHRSYSASRLVSHDRSDCQYVQNQFCLLKHSAEAISCSVTQNNKTPLAHCFRFPQRYCWIISELCWIAWAWKWRQYYPSKRRELSTRRRGITSQKTWIFKDIHVRELLCSFFLLWFVLCVSVWYCQLPTANCQLPTANCRLPTSFLDFPLSSSKCFDDLRSSTLPLLDSHATLQSRLPESRPLLCQINKVIFPNLCISPSGGK